MAELIRRKHSVKKEEVPEVNTPEDSVALEGQLSESAEKITKELRKLIPFLLKAGDVLDSLGPLFYKVYGIMVKAYTVVEPYQPQEMIPMLWGLVMMFFGGTFFTTIAAVEAYRIFGWKSSYDAMVVIIRNARETIKASQHDDQLDENNDGVADVKQISESQLITRKLLLILRTINPVEVSTAIKAISAGVLAVLATLRSTYANAITLGISLGDLFYTMTSPFVLPALKRLIPADYSKWNTVALHYFCVSIGMNLAWFIQRIISAFHGSSRGAFLFYVGLTFYLTKYAHVDAVSIKKNKLFYFLGTTFLGVFGFYYQLKHYFQIPFPMNIVLFPVSIIETLLMHLIGTASA